MVGMLEVQHEINCAICRGRLGEIEECPGDTITCPEDRGMEHLHLSLETYLECSSKIVLKDPLSFITSPFDPLGDFLFNYGLPYEQLYPYKFAAGTGYRPEFDRFPFTCPMMDRYYSPGCPDYVEGEKDGICALKDISDETGIPLDFYRYQGELEGIGLDNAYITTRQVLADNHVVVATLKWCVRQEGPLTVCEYPTGCPGADTNHAVLIIGYYEDSSSLYWIIRNSHGETGPVIMEASEAQECQLRGDMVIVGRTEGFSNWSYCPSNWLYNDPDGDFIFNIDDRCRYTENDSNELDRDCDFWPEDLDANRRGCDNCPFTWNPYQSDFEDEGIGDACDNCVYVQNEDQFDTDKDWVGDACDTSSMVPNLDIVVAGGVVADLSDSHIFSKDPPEHIREGKPYTCTDFPCRDGDATDPDPVLAPIEMNTTVENEWEGVEYHCMPVTEFRFGYTGWDVSAGYNPENILSIDGVENGFCNCTGYAGNFDDCIKDEPHGGYECWQQNQVQPPEFAPTGPGWHYLLRFEDRSRGPVPRSFARLYRGDTFVDDICPEDIAKRQNMYGCMPGQRKKWYDYDDFGKTNSSQSFFWYWPGEPELFPEPIYRRQWDADVLLYFNPKVSSDPEVGKSAFYLPHFMFRSTLHVGAFCPLYERIPWHLLQLLKNGWLVNMHHNFSADPRSASLPVPVIRYWTVENPSDPGEFAYQASFLGSAVKGMSIVEVDPFNGLISGVRKSEFASSFDIIDVEDFSAVSIQDIDPEGKTPQSMQCGNEIIPSPGSGVWVFGGKNLNGYSNDLWHGIRTVHVVGQSETVWLWQKILLPDDRSVPGAPSAAPPGRSGSALFYDPNTRRLVMWGGTGQQGPLNDLWVFDISQCRWSQIPAWGDIPPAMSGFAWSQGLENAYEALPFYEKAVPPDGRTGYPFRHVGYIYGGLLPDGRRSDALYIMELSTGQFRVAPRSSASPPGLEKAVMSWDASSGILYLFGGNDGNRYHNWIWAFDPTHQVWWMDSPDCSQGTCPYMGEGSILLSSDINNKKLVLPGYLVEPPVQSLTEAYFVKIKGQWTGSREREGWFGWDDCNNDTISEPLFGAACRNYAEWWNLPGKVRCDTFSGNLACDQEPTPQASVHTVKIPGLKQFKVKNNILYALKGRKLLTFGISNPENLIQLGDVTLGGAGRDLDFYGNKVVVACDAGLEVVNAANPSNLFIEKHVPSCDLAQKVDVMGSTAFFLTLFGVGSYRVDSGSELPDFFYLVLPSHENGWELLEIPINECGEISRIINEVGGILGCGVSLDTPFESVAGKIYFSRLRDLIRLNIGKAGFSIDAVVPAERVIRQLKADGRYVYLNLLPHETMIIDMSVPAEPVPLGPHDLEDWVRGIEVDGRSVYKMDRNRIIVAVLE